MVEMGQLGIHHDSVVTRKLLSASLENSKLKLASGYFNLTDEYMNTITQSCLANCGILMAHPTVSSFILVELETVHSVIMTSFSRRMVLLVLKDQPVEFRLLTH